MGIFDKRQSIPRRELKEFFKKNSGRIPGTGGGRYSQREREKMFDRKVGFKYGSQIDKNEFRKIVRDAKLDKLKAKTPQGKRKTTQDFRYLKEEIGGKNI